MRNIRSLCVKFKQQLWILHTVEFTVEFILMATPRSTRSASKPEPQPKTIQRTYRFDNKTFAAFEDDCAQHLSNPKGSLRHSYCIGWMRVPERAAMAQCIASGLGPVQRMKNRIVRSKEGATRLVMLCVFVLLPPSLSRCRRHRQG